jgi:hypothetical protein
MPITSDGLNIPIHYYFLIFFQSAHFHTTMTYPTNKACQNSIALAHGFEKLDIVKMYVCWRVGKAFHVGTPKLVSMTWISIKTKVKGKF